MKFVNNSSFMCLFFSAGRNRICLSFYIESYLKKEKLSLTVIIEVMVKTLQEYIVADGKIENIIGCYNTMITYKYTIM